MYLTLRQPEPTKLLATPTTLTFRLRPGLIGNVSMAVDTHCSVRLALMGSRSRETLDRNSHEFRYHPSGEN